MANRFVIDSSALAKTFLAEPESPAFLTWLKEHVAGGDDVIAPTLIAYELGEIIRQRRLGAPPNRLRILQAALNVVRLISHESVLARAMEHTASLSFYDSTFVSLAQGTQATLVTYDRKVIEYARGVAQPAISPGSK